MEPNKQVQEAIKLVFKKFIELRSARQVLLWFREESISLPRISYNEFGQELLWQLPIYKNILSILKNPFYAGAYAFGKTESRTKIVEERARKNRGHKKPMEQWLVLIKNHHTGYILWERFEENQKILSDNVHMQSTDSPKSGRGGKALLTGLLRCGHFGRMLHLTYCETAGNVARYYCKGAHINYGRERCISFGSLRADEAISLEILKAVENDAIEAAFKAAEQVLQQREDHRKALLLELEQAHYEKNLACRRYEAVDPNNRLVADELEIRWNQALQRVKEVEDGLKKLEDIQQKILLPDHTTFLYLAKDLSTVWNSASTGMDLKQRILRLLICEIIATVDKIKNELILIIHWKGGRHSELRIHKNRTGHHGRSNSMEAVEIIGQMATKFSDKIIASTLNRLGLKAGIGNSWNQSRVRSVKNYQNIRTYNTNMKHINVTLTLRDTAKELGVSQSTIRRLIKYKIITAQQIVRCAPWQIAKSELEKESVQKVIKAIQNGKKIPWSLSTNKENLMLFSL